MNFFTFSDDDVIKEGMYGGGLALGILRGPGGILTSMEGGEHKVLNQGIFIILTADGNFFTGGYLFTINKEDYGACGLIFLIEAS